MIYLLKREMLEYFSGDPKRIMHFLKVHSLAKTIGVMEHFGEWDMSVLEAAALVHDIGIKPAEAQYGKCGVRTELDKISPKSRTDAAQQSEIFGKLQEELGPDEAKPLLRKTGFSAEDINRICGIIAHHHTYSDIRDHALQALIEADLLVNLQEDGASDEAVRGAYDKIFRTNSGKELCRTIFGFSE